MLELLYTALLYLIQPLIWIRLWVRGRKAPAYRKRWGERYGFYRHPLKPGGIMLHSVSVGETLAAIPAQSSDPDAAPQYSTVLQETSVYTLDAQGLSPEEGAYLLAGQFMDSMMEESDRRTFRITEYRDLTVTVIPTLEVDEETAGIYDLAEDELVENAWIVKICAPFLYEGTLSPVGSSAGDQWIDILYQGSPVDFLMRRGGDQYTLQSRYDRIF